MNINNWLCQHFDDDKKGYVTVGAVFDSIFQTLLWLSFFGVLFLGAGLFSAGIQGYTVPENPDIIYILIISLRGLFLPIVILISATLLLMLAIYVSSIKIAKCPLKKNEELK